MSELQEQEHPEHEDPDQAVAPAQEANQRADEAGEPGEPDTPPTKVMTWTRWAVTVPCADPQATYSKVWYGLQRDLPRSDRWALRSMSYDASVVKVVVEYRARGANGNDVKRRVAAAAGVDTIQVKADKIASVNAEYWVNDDLLKAGTATTSLLGPSD